VFFSQHFIKKFFIKKTRKANYREAGSSFRANPFKKTTENSKTIEGCADTAEKVFKKKIYFYIDLSLSSHRRFK